MLKRLFNSGVTGISYLRAWWSSGSTTYSDGANYGPDRNKSNAVQPRSILEEQPRFSRWEEVRHCRYLTKNKATIMSVFSDICTYTVGAGVIPQFHGGDAAWQAEQERDFHEAARSVSADRRNSLADEMNINLLGVLRDGECFPVFTYLDDELKTPCIQTCETHVFRDAYGVTSVPFEPGFVDGIRYSDAGEALEYRTFNGEKINASAVLHLCEPRRSGELRCSPKWAGEINPQYDSKELQLGAASGFKKQLLIPVVIDVPSTKTGNPLVGPRDTTLSAADSDGNQSRFETMTGSVIYKNSTPGGGVTMQKPEYPGALYAPFQENYDRTFCAAVDWPYDFTSLTNKTGTTQRAVLEKATRKAEVLQKTLLDRFVYRWAIHRLSWRIATGQTTAPDGWWKITFQYTRSPSVDMGRETTADIAEIQNFMQSLPEYYAKHQQDFTTESKKNAAALGMTDEQYLSLMRNKLFGKDLVDQAMGIKPTPTA